MAVNIEYVSSLEYKRIKEIYKMHLENMGKGRSTIETVIADTFYLWNNGGKDLFWNTVTDDNFDETAKNVLKDVLLRNSAGNADKNIQGYFLRLKDFRSFISEEKIDISEEGDMAALRNFLLDIDCLEPLYEWTSRLNIFDILKISKREIQHSNMLSWLINPNENHGLGDSVLKGFIQNSIEYFCDEFDVFGALLMDYYDFSIRREWRNIDILAVSHQEKIVVCIENKIDSGEHDNQLSRYKKTVEKEFPGYKMMFIYLSPGRAEPSDSDNWYPMGYEDVLNIIESAVHKTKILPDAALLIENYVNTIRRDILGDNNLAQICEKIYYKHQKALDLIFDNLPDLGSQLAQIFRDWASEMTKKGEITFIPDKSVKSFTRFKTKTMSEILPDAEEAVSGWGTNNYYFYEIIYEIPQNGYKEFRIRLSLSSENIPDDLRAVCDRINEHYPTKRQKVNWKSRIPFSTQRKRVDEELSEEKIFKQLSECLKEVKKFEEDLAAALEKDMESETE